MVKFSLVTGAIKRTLYVFFALSNCNNTLLLAVTLKKKIQCSNYSQNANISLIMLQFGPLDMKCHLQSRRNVKKFCGEKCFLRAKSRPLPLIEIDLTSLLKYSWGLVITPSYVPAALYCAIHD